MTPVEASKISIPENRFRRKFDEAALRELKASIERNGLYHPIIVEKNGDGWILRAGERRLKALTSLIAEGKNIGYGPATFLAGVIPTLEFNELTPLQRLEIEVEENVVRSDFTWQERSLALAALHKLRVIQNPAHTVADTASEVLGKPALGDQRMVVADALIIEKHLADPEVAAAKSEREAIKLIRKKTEAIHRARLSLKFDKTQSRHSLHRGECLTLLESFPEAVFDIILSDPIYGIDADSFGDMASTGHEYKDSYKLWKEIMTDLPDQLFRVAKPQAHCYLFCDQRRFEELKTYMVLANWTVFPTMLVWDKGGNGMLPFPKNGPRRCYEVILYAWKGNRETLCVKSDIIRIPPVKKLMHGAQKPVALYCELLSRSANPGDTVLDCFGGSGPILVAANMMRLTATYIEQDETSYNIALGRVTTEEIDDGSIEDDGLNVEL